MPDRHATVATVAQRAGVSIGPAVDTDCTICAHHWGQHLLHTVTDNALDGGTWSCPEGGCMCFGTWAVPMPSALRQAYDEKVARRIEES